MNIRFVFPHAQVRVTWLREPWKSNILFEPLGKPRNHDLQAALNVAGLLTALVLYGVFQERLMTHKWGTWSCVYARDLNVTTVFASPWAAELQTSSSVIFSTCMGKRWWIVSERVWLYCMLTNHPNGVVALYREVLVEWIIVFWTKRWWCEPAFRVIRVLRLILHILSTITQLVKRAPPNNINFLVGRSHSHRFNFNEKLTARW
jgi:hypothetical protein